MKTTHSRTWRDWVCAALVCASGITVAVISSSLSPSPVQASERPLLAGVLQINGILRPFAEFKDHTWKRTWAVHDPGDTKTSLSLAEVPQTWTGYPGKALAEWYLAGVGESSRMLRVFQALVYPAHCFFDWGLETDFPKQTFPDSTFPVPKAGVVFTSPQEFVGMQAVDPESQDYKNVTTYVSGILQPLAEPFHLRTLARTEFAIDKTAWYYVEAERVGEVPVVDEGVPCAQESFLTGWIEQSPTGRLRFLSKDVFQTDCDGKGITSEIPLGVLRLEGQLYLFSQVNGYESEKTRISAITPNGLRILYEGAGAGC